MVFFRNFFLWLGVFSLVFVFIGCYPFGTASDNSAELSGILIEGVAASLGIPNAVLGEEEAGFVILLDTNDGPTKVIPASSGASLTKMIKFTANEDFIYVDDFAGRISYDSETIYNGDFFIFLITGENGSQLYYRVDVRRGDPYFIHTLDDLNVDNEENYQNVKFFIRNKKVNLSGYGTETSYEEIAADFGNPITIILDAYASYYLYAFEFTGTGSGTLVKSGVSRALSGTESDMAIAVALTNVFPPPPPSYDPNNPIPEEPIPYVYLENYIDSITGDSDTNPVTIKLGAVSFTNSASPSGDFIGWGDINSIINFKGKYIILDLSLCSFDANRIVGKSSPSGNDMNIIQNNTYLKGITLPSDLETIFDSAFAGCVNLTTVTIPSSVNFIESRSFAGCTGISSMVIPNGVEMIGSYSFTDCRALTTISLPESLKTIGENAFPEKSSGGGGNVLRTQFEDNGAGTYERSSNNNDWHKSA